jgi:hypothetical protein
MNLEGCDDGHSAEPRLPRIILRMMRLLEERLECWAAALPLNDRCHSRWKGFRSSPAFHDGRRFLLNDRDRLLVQREQPTIHAPEFAEFDGVAVRRDGSAGRVKNGRSGIETVRWRSGGSRRRSPACCCTV